MAALATVSDVEARWRALAEGEVGAVTAMLDDASAIVRTTVSDVDDRVSASVDYAALVVGIVARMVIRVLRNPDGLRQYAIDDYSATRDSVVSTGQLYLTGEEERLLRNRRRGAFSITLATERTCDETVLTQAAVNRKRWHP